MKLVEILAKKLDVWPTGAAIAVQDGDARKTVKFGGKHANPSIALMGLKDVWQAIDWKYTHQSDFDHSVLASDWKTAIVTHDQWQAERDRQKGGEWKRARGRKPKYETEKPQRMEVRHRDGDITQGWTSQSWNWSHNDGCPSADIMAWRIISQPQAEHADWVGPFPCATSDSTVNEIELAISYQSGVCSVEAKTEQMETPFKWRDEVTELNAYIEKYTRERDALIERLASEGFALIPPVVSVVSEFSGVDMSDWRNWRAGDVVECISVPSKHSGYYTEGRTYKVESADLDDECTSTEVDIVCDESFSLWCPASSFRFVSRP